MEAFFWVIELLVMFSNPTEKGRGGESSCPHCGGDLGGHSHQKASVDPGLPLLKPKLPDDELGRSAGWSPRILESIMLLGLILVFVVAPISLLWVRFSPDHISPSQLSRTNRFETGPEGPLSLLSDPR